MFYVYHVCYLPQQINASSFGNRSGDFVGWFLRACNVYDDYTQKIAWGLSLTLTVQKFIYRWHFKNIGPIVFIGYLESIEFLYDWSENFYEISEFPSSKFEEVIRFLVSYSSWKAFIRYWVCFQISLFLGTVLGTVTDCPRGDFSNFYLILYHIFKNIKWNRSIYVYIFPVTLNILI